MKLKLFAANLPDKITEDELGTLFADVGAVGAVELLMDEASGAFTGTAFLELDTDQTLDEALNAANTHFADEPRVSVSLRKPRWDRMALTASGSALANRIAKTLGETRPLQQRMIRFVVWQCGETFAQAAFEEALRIEAAGGMTLADGSRRRTPGGTFFYLVRKRLTPKVARSILRPQPRKKKKPAAPALTSEPVPAVAEAERKSADGPGQALAEPPAQDDLAVARERLAELRAAHQAAQDLLTAIKAGKADKSAGLFSTMQQVVALQQQIDRLLIEHPALAHAH